MSRLFVLGGLMLLFVCCGRGKGDQSAAMGKDRDGEPPVTTGEGTQVAFPILDFEALEPLLHREDEKTYVINFWATWCKPCIAEMPHFERINAEEADQGVEVILVNLDLPNMWKSRLEPFVENKGIRSKVLILDDPKQNEWIPKVSGDWGGGIPATLIYNKERRRFYERGFTYRELKTELDAFIHP